MRNKGFYSAIAILCFATVRLHAQLENAKWYFGTHAGLDFTTNPPTAVTGTMTTSEGCAAIADASGNLLFYTDGITVWNMSHTVMANGTGLNGNNSTTQSAVVVKKPGSSSIYYLFSLACCASSNGLEYSVIDMSLAAGAGSVTTKNVPMAGMSSERLTSVKHCNGTDVWVLSQEFPSGNFRAHLVTSSGVSTSSVISTIGTNSMTGASYVGYMKASPNGRKLALAAANSSTYGFEVYDFDPSTGVVSNRLHLTAINTAYGVEFSPDGTKLYGALWGGSTLYQWDLCAGSSTAIIASQYTTATSGGGALQLGINGKIYMTRSGQSQMGVVNNPNASGSSCSYTNSGQSISPNSNTYGLPNFITSGFKQPPPPFTFTLGTACQTASFTASSVVTTYSASGCTASGYSLTGIVWNFGDPGSGSSNSTTQQNPVHVFSTIGTYTVSLIIYYSCGGGTDTLRQVLNVNQPCISVTSQSISCSSLGSATVTATSGSGPFSYTWMPSNQSGSVATGLAPGSYTITVFDSGNNFTYTAQTVFTSVVPLTGNVSSGSVQCFGAATGTASMSNLAGGSGNQTYLWTNGQTSFTTPTVNTLSAGLWSITVTDALTGCQLNDVFLVLQPPAVTVNISTNSSSVCLGGSVSFTGQSSGGTAPYTYNWIGGTSSSTISVSEPTAGAYTYTLLSKDSHSCPSSGTVNANFVAPPVVTVTSVSICPQQTGTLIANGAVNFTWSTASTNQFITDTPSSTTVYTVTGEAQMCTSTATGAIIVKPVPTALVSSNSPLCAGTQLSLFANGGQSYQWSGPQSFSTNAQNPSIASATLNNAGVYSCTVTASNGCTASASGTVTVNPIPTVSAVAATVCVNGNMQLTANSQATAFAWSGPAGFSSMSQNPSFGNLSPGNNGTYSVIVTGAGGCTNIATAQGSVVVMPVPGFTTNSPRCAGETLLFGYTGTSATSYQWSGPNGFQSSFAAPSITNVPAASAGLYSLTITYGPCVAGVYAPVTVYALPTPAASYDGPVCEGKTMKINVSAAPGEVITAYQWGGPAGFAPATASATISPALQGHSGMYSVTITDIHACKASTTLSVTVLKNPTVTATAPTVCLNAPATLTASGADSYFWTGPSLKTNNVANAVVSAASSSAPVQYFVTGTAANGCTATATAFVSTWPLPTPSASVVPSATVCLNGSVSLTGNGGWVYIWTLPNSVKLSGQTVSVSIGGFDLSGTYTLDVTDRRGCSNRAVTTVSVIPPPDLGLLASSFEGCVPFCPQFTMTSSLQSIQATWMIGNNTYTGKTFHHCFSQSGTYLVKTSYSDLVTGCGSSSVFSVTARSALEAAFEWTPDQPVEGLDDVTFVNTTKGDNNTWKWYFGNEIDSTHMHITRAYDDPGKFPVVLVTKNEWGCADTMVKAIEIHPDFHIYVPNAFTPNADGTNDIFLPVTRGVYRYSLQVFDRWGAMIFSTEDLAKGWDGTYHGEPCMKGAYTWKLSAAPLDKPAVIRTGSVILYR